MNQMYKNFEMDDTVLTKTNTRLIELENSIYIHTLAQQIKTQQKLNHTLNKRK